MHTSTPPVPRRKIGDQFEERAVRHLQDRGYLILERNRIYPWGEIDIIAEDRSHHPFRGEVRTLVFIEVRGTLAGGWVNPIESILPRKVARLRRAIETYLLFYRGRATDVRIDLIAVEGEDPPVHYPDFIRLK